VGYVDDHNLLKENPPEFEDVKLYYLDVYFEYREGVRLIFKDKDKMFNYIIDFHGDNLLNKLVDRTHWVESLTYVS
jgi:hypothetical protein